MKLIASFSRWGREHLYWVERRLSVVGKSRRAKSLYHAQRIKQHIAGQLTLF